MRMADRAEHPQNKQIEDRMRVPPVFGYKYFPVILCRYEKMPVAVIADKFGSPEYDHRNQRGYGDGEQDVQKPTANRPLPGIGIAYFLSGFRRRI